MPNRSLLHSGRVLACSQLNTMMHVCRELCGGQICVTSDFAAFQDPETAPWLEKYYTINADWRSEDRRRLLAFARDLLNSDYAGHRLTFQLFARSPPFAHLAAVYRNFDRDVPLRFVHKSAGRGITFARIQHPASTRSRVTWSEHWTAKSGLRRLCPIADKGSTHDLETEGIEAPAHGGVPTLPDLRVGPGRVRALAARESTMDVTPVSPAAWREPGVIGRAVAAVRLVERGGERAGGAGQAVSRIRARNQ
jgi:hypothetical protein